MYLQREHSTDGATVGELLGDRCKSIFWSTSSTQPTDGATVRESKRQIIVMQAWPSKATQSTDGATDGEVLQDRGDPFFGVPKKGSIQMEPPMERVGDRAIVLPRGVQKMRPSDFDATRPSDFDATLGRWSLPPCLPRQSTLPSQVGCYLASQQAKYHPQPSALARRNARSD